MCALGSIRTPRRSELAVVREVAVHVPVASRATSPRTDGSALRCARPATWHFGRHVGTK